MKALVEALRVVKFDARLEVDVTKDKVDISGSNR